MVIRNGLMLVHVERHLDELEVVIGSANLFRNFDQIFDLKLLKALDLTVPDRGFVVGQ